MTDTAQLREALVKRIAEVIYQQVELHGATYDRVAEAVLDAARELLILREAGALIITPDETTDRNGDLNRVWPSWALKALADSLTNRLPLVHVLDALRDAMPDGET